jgi:hypothetical protein
MKQAGSLFLRMSPADSKVDSKHPEKLLSLVIRYEQTASLSVLERTPANICGQAGQTVHIPLFGSVSPV